MADVGTVAAMLAFGAMGVVTILAGWSTTRSGRWREKLQDMPRTLLQHAVPGPVKLVGKVRVFGSPLVAPLSGRPCCAYELRVVEPESEGADTVLVAEAESRDFWLEDETGRALVRMSLSEPILDLDRSERQSWVESNEKLIALLQPRGIDTKGWLAHRILQADEGVIEEGETVVVCGIGRREIDPDPASVETYRDGAPTRYVVAGGGATWMLVSDEPGLVRFGRRHSPPRGRS